METKTLPKTDLPTPEKPVYTSLQRWLLVGALALGLIWDRGWQSSDPRASGLYGIFFLAYLALFYALNWKRQNPRLDGTGVREPLWKNKTAGALGLSAAALCLLHGSRIDELYGLGLAAIPLLLMIHAVFATRDVPLGREWVAAEGCVKGFFVWPFQHLPQWAGAAVSLLTGSAKGKRRGVIIGLVVGLPLAVLVLWLLSTVDPGLVWIVRKLFAHLDLPALLIRLTLIITVAALFYSFLYSAVWGKQVIPAPAKAPTWPVSAFWVVMGLLLLVYALFAYVQFSYLFGGRLPADATYSRYAREGFWQLMWVSCINFAVVGTAMKKAPKSRALTVLSGAMLLSCLLLLGSALQRLLLYIAAYGLTMMRILPLWFMLYLGVVTILLAIRLVKETLPVTRIGGLGLVLWYVALNLPDWASIILRYNSAP